MRLTPIPSEIKQPVFSYTYRHTSNSKLHMESENVNTTIQ